MVGSALALTACAGTDGSADYGYEAQAPYADERTVGAEEEVVAPRQAERVFETRQMK
ncbi:MAG: hypothetical protein H6867_03910 [Rhodospirillales bacterium]|nr:hypothetical protein [Rhodospirillales bacterium]